jgi:hypothetical protein
MKNKKKVAGIGALLVAVASVVTLGLVKKNKNKKKETKEE